MLNVYLSGEIHTDWRNEIIKLCNNEDLSIKFSSPNTDHDSSDNCGVEILGDEENNFWKDNKGASINSIRTKKAIKDSDVVIVKFGEKYKQWNAAFDAGFAVASDIPLIVVHGDEDQHALKEVDASALVVVDDPEKVANALSYVIKGKL